MLFRSPFLVQYEELKDTVTSWFEKLGIVRASSDSARNVKYVCSRDAILTIT